MTWEVARNSLDCFLDITSGQPTVKVVFFGGEPLLNWELVRSCLLYLRGKSDDREIQVRLVSNLTLLGQSIMEELIAYNVQVQVSLDGPQHIHDNARSFEDGRGTFKHVCDRLAEIRALDPDYFRNNVSLLCTFNKQNDILEIFRYFSEGIFTELSVVLNYVTGFFSDQFVPSPEQASQHEDRIDQLIELYFIALRQGTPFRYDFFWNIMGESLHFGGRTIGLPPEEKWPNGTCVPGAHRLFVTSGGTFYPCENFCHEGWDVGNHETGFEFPKAQALFNAYANLCQKSCQDCWAYRLCSCCYLSTVSDDEPLISVDAEQCDYQKERILKAFRRFVYIWENEPLESHNHPFSLHFQLKKQSSKTNGQTANI